MPQLGAAPFFALLIAGQMLGSIVFDHFGILGVPVYEISAMRLLGAALLSLFHRAWWARPIGVLMQL